MGLASRLRAPVPERAQGPLAVFGFLGLVAAVFSAAWFSDRVFFQRDIYAYWYPHIEAFVRVVHQGIWPLWNPYVTFGTPLLADPNLQLAYPLTWLNLVLQPATYFKLFVLVHCLGAGMGAWLLARQLRLGSLSALLVGGAWMASGPLLSSVSLFHHFASAAWAPWVLWALNRALDRRTVSSTLVLGTVGAGQLLAGSADIAFMTALLASAIVASFVLSGRPSSSASIGRRLRTAGRVVPLAVAYTTLLAAVQWWPTLAHVGAGSRLDFDPQTSLYWSLHPASLLDLVVPRLVAELPLNEQARAAVFEGRGPLLASVYLGIPCLALGAVAFLHARRRLPFALVAGVVFLVTAALGRHAPLLPTLLELPVFGLFRYPPKYLLPAALLWALLAGVGLETIIRPASAGRSRGFLVVGFVVAGGAVALAALAVWLGGHPPGVDRLLVATADRSAVVAVGAGKLWIAAGLALSSSLLLVLRWSLGPRPWLAVPWLILAVADLAVAGRPLNALAPPELLLHRPPLLDSIESESPPRRVFVMSYPFAWLREQGRRATGDGQPEWESALGDIDRLRPPIGARWHVGGSYDGSFTGQAPPALSQLSLAAQAARDSPLLLRLLHLGSVDYVVALHDPGLPGLTEVGRFESVYSEPVRLLRVEEPLPPSFVVGEARISRGSDALYGLLDHDFDPRREVVLAAPALSGPDQDGGEGAARITRWVPGAIDLEASANAPGYLVVAETWDQGWRARIDGEPAEVLRANVLFCGVRLPAGAHRVQLLYRPAAAVWGAAASGLAIVVGLAVWGVDRRRRIPIISAPR